MTRIVELFIAHELDWMAWEIVDSSQSAIEPIVSFRKRCLVHLKREDVSLPPGLNFKNVQVLIFPLLGAFNRIKIVATYIYYSQHP